MESGLQHTIIVVSPLKSLIKDQVARFSGRGMKVQGLHADTTDEERRGVLIQTNVVTNTFINT